MIASPVFAGRSFHVLGLARTGLSVVAALLESGATVAAWDTRDEARRELPQRVVRIDPMAAELSSYDALVVSPGVPLNTHPLAAHAVAAGVPIIGDIELFARARGSLPRHKVIGITGTNGKSTVTALVHHTLTELGVPTTMGGNIGLPILSQDPLPEGGVYVLELSSYQIDLTKTLACEVAVHLNLSPDHLDRYDGSMDKYAAAKARLFEMQDENGIAILTGTDDRSVALRNRLSARVTPTDSDLLNDQPSWPSLQGPHNRTNAAAATAAVRGVVGADDEQLLAALRSFPGLPHRMERIAELGGVLWVNDSKATNAESAAPALAAFDKVHWILGGLAKSADLSICAPHYGRVKEAILIGDATDMFAETLDGDIDLIVRAGTLDEAVRHAAENAKSGDTVLLSPACASFDQFKDFEARGDRFRALVGNLAA
ncbi:MAG: UDP-N-acetylmuramoyl-L-alanine--D-glutamate ligase [Pacificimonas sp.]